MAIHGHGVVNVRIWPALRTCQETQVNSLPVMQHSVILNLDPSHPDFALFELFGQRSDWKGQVRLELRCEEAIFDGPVARLTLCEPEDLRGLILVIPFHHILLAYCSQDDRRLGFHAA